MIRGHNAVHLALHRPEVARGVKLPQAVPANSVLQLLVVTLGRAGHRRGTR